MIDGWLDIATAMDTLPKNIEKDGYTDKLATACAEYVETLIVYSHSSSENRQIYFYARRFFQEYWRTFIEEHMASNIKSYARPSLSIYEKYEFNR